MSLAEFLKKERRPSPVLMFAAVVAFGVIAGSYGLVAPERSASVAATEGSQSQETGEQCEKKYNDCLTIPLSQTECERRWKECMTSACKLDKEEIGEETAQRCPTDSYCQRSCQQSVIGAEQATVECCRGGPQRNLACKKIWLSAPTTAQQCLDNAKITSPTTPGTPGGAQPDVNELNQKLAGLRNNLDEAGG